MPSANYLAGWRVEYQLTKLGREQGWYVARSSGSHGAWDVVWWRQTGMGTAPFLVDDHMKKDGWFPLADHTSMPEELSALNVPVAGYFKFTKGVSKRVIWVWTCGDGFSQAAFFQAKRHVVRKKKGKI